jgi:ABC-type polysaccharide/polyol phosphate export permease
MRFLRNIIKYRKYIVYAGITELKAEVAGSYLNWLWWIVEPICFMFIYSLVFGVFFGSKIEHFNLFVYIGITLWDFFRRMLTSSVRLVKNNKSVVAKVYIPKYILIFVKMFVNGFKMMICFIIMFLMLVFTGIGFSWKLLYLVPILLIMCVFTFGFCSILLHFGVYIDDLHKLITIALRMIMYLTGVFYDVVARVSSNLGNEIAMLIVRFNPMASTLIAARSAAFYQKTPDFTYLFDWLVVGLVLSIIGVVLIDHHENDYVKVI